jgi:hypothetical protein
MFSSDQFTPLSALLARYEKEQAYEVSLGCKAAQTLNQTVATPRTKPITYELWIGMCLGVFYFASYYYLQ